ncbi:NAD(P)H-dependent oxidoreductase [Blastococcus sp. LR1]|uniref:NAD(P)H-dependent oxidoreductase n=1 Tax=Blastococcus sp. LR1 TaxID=2877000 RepID=UPI001CCD8CDB|nr:NAD(P)H-dependent oxidoreductase [Blastococcus sp. LR1]MCA0144340.1 NAD(P)H-dependent oxidoreductase [Blastococcus sp. LR1]
MSTLIVTAHPDPDSLTHSAARRLRELIGTEGSALAHLAQEGFDPRFSPGDRRTYVTRGVPDPAVTAEQRRIDAADHLVLVFPVYWWSVPALLKGWIDRVFIAGWAFTYDDDDRVVPQLGRVTAHLLPISGTAAESFARHGYTQSFATQIERGVVDFCGMRRGVTAFVHDSESEDGARVARDVEAAVTAIASAITGSAPDVPANLRDQVQAVPGSAQEGVPARERGEQHHGGEGEQDEADHPEGEQA